VNFARLTARSVEAIARVVDRDDEFRARVAAVVDEGQVGRAGWLWLARPDGWAAELADIQGESATQAAAAAEEREERVATRKLAAAQAAAGRAEAEATERLAALEGARAELAQERAARAAADERVADLEAVVAELSSSRAEVVRNLKDVESRFVARATEVNAVKARLRALEDETRRDRARAVARSTPDETPGSAGAGPSASAPLPVRGPPPTPAPPAAPAPPSALSSDRTPRPRGADPTAVAAEVARAARGAAGLADALASLARLVGDGNGGAPDPDESDAGGSGPDGATTPVGRLSTPDRPTGAGAADPSAEGTPARSPSRRVPVTLPGGMFDDTVEAAEHLLRTPGAVLLVDGYNITMQGWPELSVAEQRRRLVMALTDLTARVSTRAEVVFDGAEVEAVSVPAPVRPLLRVRFSAPGVEADDVVIDLVGRLPAATPVIVASSDNRVRDSARRRGANLLHAHQLVAVLRR